MQGSGWTAKGDSQDAENVLRRATRADLRSKEVGRQGHVRTFVSVPLPLRLLLLLLGRRSLQLTVFAGRPILLSLERTMETGLHPLQMPVLYGPQIRKAQAPCLARPMFALKPFVERGLRGTSPSRARTMGSIQLAFGDALIQHFGTEFRLRTKEHAAEDVGGTGEVELGIQFSSSKGAKCRRR